MKMFKKVKKLIPVMAIAALPFVSVSCSRAASTVSHNISKDADEFRINRRVIFYNGITDTYMLTIEGYLSIRKDSEDGQLEVTCKTGPASYKKHYLGISDNVTYFVEQLDGANVSEYHHKVILRPKSIVPSFEIK
jgi:hypothetical protein